MKIQNINGYLYFPKSLFLLHVAINQENEALKTYWTLNVIHRCNCSFDWNRFPPKNAHTEALRSIAFPEQTELIHFFFFTCVKLLEVLNYILCFQDIWHKVFSKHVGGKLYQNEHNSE